MPARVDLVREVRVVHVGDLVRFGAEAPPLRQRGQANSVPDPFDEPEPGWREQDAHLGVSQSHVDTVRAGRTVNEQPDQER
ncbi:hypothetical protein SAMN05414137_12729 [Streptacidiphilus jiangxiensis]|uniref:Uncharacterized protein n=1 Tax=Streptacidiphilus jiangxiensis TaxID=235985 RepID=A0A1H7Y722_STRJI|nr:hypothetical protein SAMN05414137_12729 [Streptacidiphilus jiangxiensis]